MKRRNKRLMVVVCFTCATLGGFRMSAQSTAVPAPWAAQDIGSPAIAGSSSFAQASGTFSITAGGADIWGTTDQFHFVYQPLVGDAEITARVNTLSAADPWSKAGVMIRSSLSANAAHAFTHVSAGSGAAFQRRRTVGASSVAFNTSGSAPLWVRLVRRGSTVTSSTSANGTSWTTLGSDTIALGATAYVGVAVTSHNVSQSTSAAVSSVTATRTGALPSPQQSQDIGSPAIAGSASFSQGTYTVTAASRNVGGTADQFHFVYQPLTGDMDVRVRVASLAGSPTRAKAGVMIRETLTAGSPHAFAALSRDNGYLFQRRPTAGGTSVSTAVAGATPGWVRLQRTGDLITAYRSLDGTTWTVTGSDSFPMADTVYVGIAVTSRDVAAATTATLTNLIINQSLPPNQPPTATLSAPVSGATFTAPATIDLTASASDADGTVARVDFFNGTTLLASDTTAPYAIAWSNVAAGTYALTATAVDNAGATGSSATATVTVTTPANQSPTATLTSPANGASFTAPATIPLTASAADSDGTVARVDFYNGSTLLGSDTTAPYTFTWTNVAAGSYALQATAVDDAGASGSSSVASVTVTGANQPPTVTLTAPANGATFTAPATIALAASASDPENSVNRVEFYRGTTLLGTDTTAPYGFTWSSVPAGTYSLTAVAYDAGGSSAQSAAVGVTVTAPNQPPAVALTAPAHGATYTAPASIAITANASDPENQLARVEFYSGTTLLGTDTAAPYAFTWSAVPAGTYSLRAVAYDGGGLTGTTASVSVTVTATGQLPPGQQAVDIGAPAIAGSTTYSGGSYQIHAGGADFWNTADQFHYVYQQMSGDIDVSARIVSQSFSDEWAKAGVMIRVALDAASPNVATTLSAGRSYAFQRRPASGSPTVATNVTTGPDPGWVRLTRTGALVTAYRSSDGQNWIAIGSDSIAMPDSVYVGIAVTSHNTTVATDAVVDNFRATANAPTNQIPTATLTSPANGASYTAPATVSLAASASDADGSVARVDFYNGTTLLGSDTTAPYAFTWSNVAAGTYALKATAVDNAGASGSSAVASVTVNAANQPPTVTLTAPANGATFAAPANLTLTANAADANGSVARVEFYNGAALLGTDTTAPYAFAWSGVPAGTYALRAIAYDNVGASTASATATITVSSAPLPPPTAVVFQASADHATVTSYLLQIFANGADPNTATPVASSDLGKPAPAANGDITVNRATLFSGLAPGTYLLTISSIGPNGTSRSESVTFTR